MQKRNSKGGAIAEFPAAIILLMLGFVVPLIIMASMFYKVYIFSCIVKNGTQLGATQPDMTTATSAASSYLTSNTPGGISISTPVITMIKKPVTYTSAAGPQTYQSYFLQVQATGTMAPLLKMGSFFGTVGIPGLTGNISLSDTQAVYFENQTAAAAAGP
jgi:hypothetical protein